MAACNSSRETTIRTHEKPKSADFQKIPAVPAMTREKYRRFGFLPLQIIMGGMVLANSYYFMPTNPKGKDAILQARILIWGLELALYYLSNLSMGVKAAWNSEI